VAVSRKAVTPIPTMRDKVLRGDDREEKDGERLGGWR
jgi:hypothetical protein